MRTSIAMLFGLLCATACERTAQPQDAKPVVADTTASVTTSPQAVDSARILYETGRAEFERNGYDSAAIAYMKARPEHFFYNENHDFYAYNGIHFRELLRRYPHSEVADDAAYQLTDMMDEGPECEGWVPCYAHTQWEPMAVFLRAYPTSPLADRVVTRALDLFGRALDPEVYRDPYDYEIVEMREILAGFDSVTSGLPEPLRNRTDSALIQWRAWVEQSDD